MNEVATKPPETQISYANAEIAAQVQLFELAQRRAAIYAKSSLVPKEYQNNIGNVLIAENMANRMGADTLMVMQNLYIVHNRPSWSAQFLISCFNTCGRFSSIKYRFTGKPDTDDYGCVAYCTELSTGQEISGTRITWKMAKAEGWVNKNGSKWQTMPEQMFRYRSAAYLIRVTAPEIGMGLYTKEELEDMGDRQGFQMTEPARLPAANQLDALTAELEAKRNGAAGTADISDDTTAETADVTADTTTEEPAQESDTPQGPSIIDDFQIRLDSIDTVNEADALLETFKGYADDAETTKKLAHMHSLSVRAIKKRK